jgi:hypothetical protein
MVVLDHTKKLVEHSVSQDLPDLVGCQPPHLPCPRANLNGLTDLDVHQIRPDLERAPIRRASQRHQVRRMAQRDMRVNRQPWLDEAEDVPGLLRRRVQSEDQDKALAFRPGPSRPRRARPRPAGVLSVTRTAPATSQVTP